MTKVRVIIEYVEVEGDSPKMRWERVAEAYEGAVAGTAAKGNGGPGDVTFELLGRAFEVAQREEGAAFPRSLSAFFRGALMRKEDVADVLLTMED